MPLSTPLLMVPGLLCSARLYGPQVAGLWRFGPVMVADHRWDDTMEAIAGRILREAPPRFALAGLSMGGYIALAMMRQAPERITRLALLDTGARPDMPEHSAVREKFIALAEAGKLSDVVDTLIPRFLHADRQSDEALKNIVRVMADETGVAAFVRQQRAIMSRPDARPMLSSIKCPTLVLVGEGDTLTPPVLSEEMVAALPNAWLTVVPDSGHLSTLERPEAVNAALVDWLQR